MVQNGIKKGKQVGNNQACPVEGFKELGKTSGDKEAPKEAKDKRLTWNMKVKWKKWGLNCTPKQSNCRQVMSESQLNVCVILESHVEINTLANVCSKVFRNWDWTSNAGLCNKGCRIILGWNKDVVDVIVMHQTDQAIHAKVIHQADQKIICCTFIYAGNDPRERRVLWADLKLHKRVTMYGALKYSTGLHFTWSQKPRRRNGVLKKLDRIMGNLDFVDTYQGAYAIFQPYRISDHSPSVLKIPSLTCTNPRPFKFYNFLAHKGIFLELLNTHWNASIVGHSMFQELDEVQKALDRNPSNSDIHGEEAVYVQAFDEAKIDEERFMRQKAKIDWQEGEVTGSGVSVVFVSHYESFIGSSLECDLLNTKGLFNKKFLDGSNMQIIRPITNAKIKTTMFDIGEDKASGPDVYTSMFLKKGRHVVGADVCKAIHDLFSNGKLLNEINHTFMTFIPKIATPQKVNDYRPISCCNVIYKCISKIITNHIKEVVSENQSAFVLGRRFSDNILLTQELMHNYHLKRGSPRCAFKVDIQKAYDTVDWRILGVIFKFFGFHSTMIK
ncbi:putative RNA-directed DNA polymerase, eukaryota, reverse transcriptase zinc-binding domain protein [Tanacetum coccineum]